MIFGRKGVSCHFQGHTLHNTTSQILSEADIELFGRKLLNQTGRFCKTTSPYSENQNVRATSNNLFHSRKQKDVTVNSTCIHTHFMSNGSEIGSSDGNINLFVQTGVNSGSSICAAKKLFINGREYQTESDLPSSLISEPISATSERLASVTNFEGVLDSVCIQYQKSVRETLPALIKAGKLLLLKMGLFKLSGNANSSTVMIDVDQLDCIRNCVRQDHKTGDVIINLGSVVDKMRRDKSMFTIYDRHNTQNLYDVQRPLD